MMGQEHERNMGAILEALRAAGIGAERFGRSGFVCSINGVNFELSASPTAFTLMTARRHEGQRLASWINKYTEWERAALNRAAEAEQVAKRHHAILETYQEQLNQLDY